MAKSSKKRNIMFIGIEHEPEKLPLRVCNHGQVESKIHWVLYVAFKEDKCRIRKEDGINI